MKPDILVHQPVLSGYGRAIAFCRWRVTTAVLPEKISKGNLHRLPEQFRKSADIVHILETNIELRVPGCERPEVRVDNE